MYLVSYPSSCNVSVVWYNKSGATWLFSRKSFLSHQMWLVNHASFAIYEFRTWRENEGFEKWAPVFWRWRIWRKSQEKGHRGIKENGELEFVQWYLWGMPSGLSLTTFVIFLVIWKLINHVRIFLVLRIVPFQPEKSIYLN